MKIRVEYKLTDLWIGLFWKHEGTTLHLWVCLVPCFPIHLEIKREVRSWQKRRLNGHSGAWPMAR